MNTKALQERIACVDPEVLLVPPRVLRRVVRSDRQITTRLVPHTHLYRLPRERLLDIVAESELSRPANTLPESILLLPTPGAEPEALLLYRYSRLLFHGAAHRAFDRLQLDDAALAQRIEALGAAEFAEAREVLRQENLLLEGSDREVYEEFAALFLELRLFAPEQVRVYFPACSEPQRVEALFQADLNAAELYRHCWLQGASLPQAGDVSPLSPAEDEPSEEANTVQLRSAAEQAERKGNLVRAMLLRQRAYAKNKHRHPERIAPRVLSLLEKFTTRLLDALEVEERSHPAWKTALAALILPASRGYWNLETRLLYDLQKVCIDLNKKIFAADLVEWLVTWGRRPIRRPLPDLPLVLAVTHLRKAQERLTAARLDNSSRDQLHHLLGEAEHQLETRMRRQLKPKIREALEQAGLRPLNRAEHLSRDRLVEELLDRVVAIGALTLGDLRDAVARNRVKLPDLPGPGTLLRGDPLLRANENLALSLDGIARRGEIYLRWMQSFSSVFFGTRVGRTLTLYLLLPLLASLFTLKGLDALLGEVQHVVHWVAHLGAPMDEGGEPLHPEADPDESPAVKHAKSDILFHWLYTFLPLAFFYVLVLHVSSIRHAVGRLLYYGLWVPLRATLYDLPVAVLSFEPLRKFLVSRPFQIFMRVVGRPALSTLLPLTVLYLAAHFRLADVRGRQLQVVLALWFAGVSVFLSTRWGRDFEEHLAEFFGRVWDLFHRDFLLGIWNFFTWLFRTIGDRLDQWRYAVDERLRFREGETAWDFWRKAVLGFFWFGIVYMLRMIIILFVEPQVNPIKHFPVVTVSHKLSLLAIIPIADFTGIHPGYVTVVLGLIPGIFGFLAWELKENWRLYRANDSATVDSERIGSHGEHVIHYIRPGFHSGTLPALFAKYRRQPNGRAARRIEEGLHHVEEELRRFVERELCEPLHATSAWSSAHTIRPGAIQLATNRIRIELLGPATQAAAVLEFVNQQGRLAADWVEPGWKANLSEGQRVALEGVLENFWSRSGVEILQGDPNFGEQPLRWSEWVARCESAMPSLPGAMAPRMAGV
jgi:hypothetical protein